MNYTSPWSAVRKPKWNCCSFPVLTEYAVQFTNRILTSFCWAAIPAHFGLWSSLEWKEVRLQLMVNWIINYPAVLVNQTFSASRLPCYLSLHVTRFNQRGLPGISDVTKSFFDALLIGCETCPASLQMQAQQIYAKETLRKEERPCGNLN